MPLARDPIKVLYNIIKVIKTHRDFETPYSIKWRFNHASQLCERNSILYLNIVDKDFPRHNRYQKVRTSILFPD